MTAAGLRRFHLDNSEIKEDGLGRSGGLRLAQTIRVLPGEFPRVVRITGKVHDLDFGGIIQSQPKLILAEQWFCFHRLIALRADCLYRFHMGYGTPAVRARQEKPTPLRAPRLDDHPVPPYCV